MTHPVWADYKVRLLGSAYGAFVIGLVGLLCVTSCVPRRKQIYLRQPASVTTVRPLSDVRDEYRLQPEDLIDLNIFSLTPGQFDIFSGRGEDGTPAANFFRLDRTGKVNLPAIGEIEIGGLTLSAAEDTIEQLLTDYLRAPLVRITLRTPFTFTVLGEVGAPGRYVLEGEQITILEAIGLAGDLTRFADRSQIKILRHRGTVAYQIDTLSVLSQDFLYQPTYYLQSEDVVIVDPLSARTIRDNQIFVITTLASMAGAVAAIFFILSNR